MSLCNLLAHILVIIFFHFHGNCSNIAKLLTENSNIELVDIINELENQQVTLPIILRFPEIIGHRIKVLNESFQNAITCYNYNVSISIFGNYLC